MLSPILRSGQKHLASLTPARRKKLAKMTIRHQEALEKQFDAVMLAFSLDTKE